jgi:uncharacterized membrane protein YraQ (UPF0718 family)
MRSPFENLSKNNINKITLIFFVTTVLCSLFLKYLDSYLITDSCLNGIVSFELAKELSLSQEMLNSWTYEGRIAAGLSTGFDYLYLIIYSFFFAILIHRLNEVLWRGKPFYKVGLFLIYGMFLAALFDGIENAGLIQLLLGNESQFWTSIAYYFALMKFILLAISLLYLIINFLFSLFQNKQIK